MVTEDAILNGSGMSRGIVGDSYEEDSFFGAQQQSTMWED